MAEASRAQGDFDLGGDPEPVARRQVLIARTVVIVVILALWQGIVSVGLVDAFWISSPILVVNELWRLLASGDLVADVSITVFEALIAFVVSSALGIAAGLLLARSPFWDEVLAPLVLALNSLPRVALAPLFVLWFGLGIESKIALAAVLVLFLVFLNTFAGVREVDQDLIDGARLMKATRAQVILKVIIPSAMSWVFAGLKIAMPYALIGAVLGEMIAANRGLGYLVQFSGSQFDTAGVFAVLFVIALLAVALNHLVDRLQSRIERWRIVSR